MPDRVGRDLQHVRGLFEQDTYDTPSGELSALGGYMTAKFLWNPDYDENTAINEFLDGYYGPAAKPIRRWEILLGKWLGLEVMLTLYLLLMAGGVLLVVHILLVLAAAFRGA